ncbi:hypothetical protein OAD37_03605 [Gammaproteobacteria bacterium]|nr:hypothetical protein [Gammaproteobacteria bacterium]MDC1277352.1 hypothetical protein [Gammaproteobacteria bacterium]
MPNLEDRTIVYRPKKNERKALLGWNNVLLMGGYDDFLFAKKNGISFYPFITFYSLLNLNFFYFVEQIFSFNLPKRVIVFTDIGLDSVALSYFSKKYGFHLWCFQHGLFPADHGGVLDGDVSSVNVVNSNSQKQVLKDTGYKGKIISSPNFFHQYDRPLISEWIKHNKPVVFIGPGYIENLDYKNRIDDILTSIHHALPSDHTLLYRPHPRENVQNYSSVVRRLVAKDEETTINSQSTMIFIGIKSTLLYEAEQSGRLSILIEDADLPKYFKDGEISRVIMSHSIHSLMGIINEFIKKN